MGIIITSVEREIAIPFNFDIIKEKFRIMVANEDHYTQGGSMDRRKALIFDMDGTMFDTEPISYQCWREVSARYGYDLNRTVFDQMLGRDNLRIRSICEAAFGKAYPYDRICREKVALQMEFYQQHDIPVKAGLQQVLEYARKEDLICAVASSSPRAMIEYLLERKGIASFFAVVQSGEEAPHGKPEPDIFLMACEKAGVLPQTALVIEDSESGILAAHKAGIPSIWVPDLIEIDKEVQAMAWHICQSLAEVPDFLEKNTARD